MQLRTLLTVTALAAAAFATPAAAQARVEVGVLRCTVEGGVGLIIGSSKGMSCVFRRRGADEFYTGRVSKIGLDIGITKRTVISWGVFATTANVPPASLAGVYGGLSAEATVGVGIGANALIGGSRKSIILQPLSVQGQTGLNIAAGIAGMRLRASE
jgi:Protein of unknown function (DUF992)